jgi:hypothetical protein
MLLLDAPLLLLDEPAAGLDVKARAELLGHRRGLSARGPHGGDSSHILPELRIWRIASASWTRALGGGGAGAAFFDRGELKAGLGGNRWRRAARRGTDAGGAAGVVRRARGDGRGVEFSAASAPQGRPACARRCKPART